MSESPAGAALAVIDMARNGQFAELCERFAPPLQHDGLGLTALRAAVGGRGSPARAGHRGPHAADRARVAPA